MKKYINCMAALALAAFAMTSCDEGSFGGDYKVEGVELQEMCGTWCCTFESNDPWFTVNYYNGQYDAQFLNDYFGDPYGNYNPDANADGIVDEKDFALYEQDPDYENLWYEEYEGVYNIHTANSAANNTTEMVISDAEFWGSTSAPVNFKVKVNASDKTFSVGSVVDEPYEVLSIHPSTIAKTYSNGDAPVVLGGKILPGAATAPGSGMKTDSIFFYIKYADDYGQDMYYRVSGYRKTGYREDD